MDRRSFLRRLPALPLGPGCLALSAGVGGCATVPYVVGQDAAGSVLVPVSAFHEGREAIVESGLLPRPLYVRRVDTDQYTALLLRCTHRGCQPEPIGERLECPCHGSQYDLNGRVLVGPAQRPLTSFGTHREGETLVIELGSRP
jgi:cytochrome b6-f complex iron-sulfur subunit